MSQTTIDRFEKSGHIVILQEIALGYPIVGERRYVVRSKVPGKGLMEYLYKGANCEQQARDQFEWIKSLIDLNH